jgi:hypothetical protein
MKVFLFDREQGDLWTEMLYPSLTHISIEKKMKKKTVSPQGEKFIEAARALGCDESEERFNEMLAKVARHKPSTDSAKESKRKKPAATS